MSKISENVIRHDLIQLDFESGKALNALMKLQEDMDKLKKSVMGIDDKNGFDDVKKSAEKLGDEVEDTKDGIDKMKDSVNKIKPTNFEKLTNSLKKVGKQLSNIGKKAVGVAFAGLKKLAGLSFKGLLVGLAGVGTMLYKAVSSYADYQQLVGGVETLFGAGGAKSAEEYAKNVGKSVSEVKDEFKSLKAVESDVLKNANNAYKTAGLSANEYMSTATSFSASLISSLKGDTKKASQYADMAIVDMADNANKMGTDMSLIQNAYQGFAKQNYTMLDNLKLGYGGTKTEMERLVKDASKIDKSVKANDMSFGNIVKAIHTVQEKMGIMGTTAKEANFTISGSIASTKSAWQNLMPALIQGGDQFDQCVNNLIESIIGVEDKTTGKLAGGLINNLLPATEKALEGIGTLIERLAPILEEHLPPLIDRLLPPMIKASTALVKGLIKSLPNIIKIVIKELPDIAKQLGTAVMEAFNIKMPSGKGGGVLGTLILSVLGITSVSGIAGKVVSKLKGIKELFSKTEKSTKKTKKSLNPFNELAKIKTKTVLKGMANLAIIIGGFTLIAGALMLVAPYMAKLTDAKSLIEVIGTIAVLGIVGTVLTKCAGTIGNIPVSTVAKGLANIAIILAGMSALYLLIGAISLIKFDMKALYQVISTITVLGIVGTVLTVFAGIVGLIPVPVVALGLANIAIIIGGMSALFLLIGACSLLKFDYTKMFKIIKIIAVLGSVGAILTVFAGIVGLIPIPIVLAGLTNMGLVLGGITALIVAFGKLSEIKGFNEFIEKGGETLSKIFNVIGKCVGSVIGGLGEGISNSLPKIGENIGKFGENIKPLFTSIGGVDMGGVGQFFKALVSLLGIATGNGIVEGIKSFFGGDGESSLAKLGTQLGEFATKSKSFFDTVATMKDESFNKAKMFFECLAGVKGLPAEGGIKSWWSGGINYESLANGLGLLARKKVVSFFNSVSGISAGAFENGKSLFNSLAEMKALPKEGGIKGWFSGDIDYESIVNGLGQLAGEGSKKFFSMVGGLSENTFTNATALFNTLAGMKELPKKCGFFEVLDKGIDDVLEKITELPKKMGEGLKSSGESLSSAMAEIWKDAVEASVAPVNKILDGANKILKEFGSEKRVAKWQPYGKSYANGTSGHKGGNALVNDGRGAELVQMPNGNTFIPRGRNVFIPNAPKGMKVLPAEQTAQLMGRKSPTFRYAKGTGDYTPYKNGTGIGTTFGNAMATMIKPIMEKWLDKETAFKTLADYVAGAGVEQWRSTVVRALKMEGQYTTANVERTLMQMRTESGGNPKAINLWDSNAKKGIPSKGLMQVIDPTFNAYARAGFNKNIYDPLSNILASIRYAVSRYGSLAKAYRGVGYANGGIATKPSIFGEAGAEMAIPLTRNKRRRGLALWQQTGDILGAYTPEGDAVSKRGGVVEYNNISPTFNLTVNGGDGVDSRALARKVKTWVKEGIQDTFDMMSVKNPKLQEI